jgi:translation initiation factor IF-3
LILIGAAFSCNKVFNRIRKRFFIVYVPASSDSKHKVNRGITAVRVLVIDENGDTLGALSRNEALDRAAEVSLDLVEVSPNSDPPVCRIMDYGKFRYESKKKKTEAKKNQKIVNIKEIKLTPNIGEHDYQVKMASLKKFIASGDKVKVTLRFRGRELSHKELGEKLIDRVLQECEGFAKPEDLAKMEGKQMVMTLCSVKA